MYDRFYYTDNIEKAKQQAIENAKTEFAWVLNSSVDYTNFDLRYVPSRFEYTQSHAWGSHNNANAHTTWLLPVAYLRTNDTADNFHSEILPGKFIAGWEWITDDRIDYTNFNFNWLPDSWEWDKNHAWAMRGTTKLAYTFLKRAGAAETVYHTSDLMFDIDAAKEEWQWTTDPRIDYTNFDFNWLPDAWDIDKVHCFTMAGTTQLSYTRLINKKVEQVEDKFHLSELKFLPDIVNDEWIWVTDDRIDYTNFDFNWLPDAWDIDKVHCFTMRGCKQLHYTRLYNKKHKINEECKYHPSHLEFKTGAAADEWVWITDDRIDYTNFDFNWLPDAWDIDKVHCFTMAGTAQLSYTRLINKKVEQVEDKFHHSELKFLPDIVNDEWVWTTDPRIDYTNFDFNWLPDAWDIDKVHCFTMAGLEQLSYTKLVNKKYIASKSKFHKSNLRFKPNSTADEWVWTTDPRIDYTNFDFNWLPDAWDIDKVHCFTMAGSDRLYYTWVVNVNHKDSTIKKLHKADLRFIDPIKKIYWPDNKIDFDWLIDQQFTDEWAWVCDRRINYDDFDFEWLPSLNDSKYIHCFSMACQIDLSYTWLVNTNTFKKKNFKTIESTLQFNEPVKKIQWPTNSVDIDWLVDQQITDEWVWVCDSRIDYSSFNFDWLPSSYDSEYIYCFSMNNQSKLSYTWLVNTHTFENRNFKIIRSNLKFIEPVKKIYWPENIVDFDWILDQQLTDEWVWICDKRIDYSDFNFDMLPSVYDREYIYCFGMNNQPELSYTWLINTHTLNKKQFKFINSDLRFFDLITKIYWPDFLTTELSGVDWIDSLTNWVINQDIPNEWVWVCDSRINYDTFDFEWLPTVFDKEFIHCFSMNHTEKLSYTWLVNTQTLVQKKHKFIESNLRFNTTAVDTVVLDMGFNNNSFGYYQKKLRFVGTMEAMLHSAVKRATAEWLYVISTCCDYMMFDFAWLPELDQIDHTHCWPSNDQLKGDTFLIHVPSYLKTNEFKFNFDHDSVHRVPWPARIYEEDSLAAAMNNHDRSESIYVVYYKQDSVIKKFPTPCLWDKRPVVGMNDCNSVSLVPRDCVVKEEIYEYPYLERHIKYAHPCSLDVVFIHNGEKDAGNNLNRCNTWIPPNTYFKISSGVNGRLKAYQAAADMSNSEWFLAIFAKCHMKESFRDFTWRPDYWQKPKHYIFHNHNVDLDLTYGHMAPIAYNKRLMLENTGGLDMTMAQEHAVVPVVLSETRLTDPWDTWRTAFRETVKLMYYAKEDNSIELQYRLDRWLNAEEMWAKHNPWYQYGSNDARDFFESVDGEWGWIMVTNEWDWLRKRFDALYSKSLPLQL